jgi:hypothetical protein
MRTRLLVATLVLALGALVLAPAAASAQATAGVKGGVNFSNVDLTGGDLTLSFDQNIGGAGGLFVAYDMTRAFGLQAEALFSQKGTRSDNAFGSGEDLKIRVDYIEVPVLARANLRAADRATVHLFGGPSFAARLRDSQKIGSDSLEGEERLEVRRYDVGATVGAALDLNRFIVDVRYTFGLLNINDGPDRDEFEVKTRTFTTMVGFRIW